MSDEVTIQDGSNYDDSYRSSSRSPLEHAALLMLGLGEKAAGNVIRLMPPDKIMTLSRAMENIQVVRRDDLAQASEALLSACDESSLLTGSEYVSRTLQEALGEDRAKSLLKFSSSIESNPVLERLLWLEAGEILAMIRNEKPQLQAVVLACLSPDKGSAVLAQLPEVSRLDLANRLARLKDIPLTSLDTVADLISSFETGSSDSQPIHGAGHLAEMINYMDDMDGTWLLNSIKETDEELASEVSDLRLNFEHLLGLDLANLTVIIENASQDTLALALKGVPELRLERVFSCLSKRASKYLKEEIEGLGSVRMSLVRNARHEILELARRLEADEQVELHANDELVI